MKIPEWTCPECTMQRDFQDIRKPSNLETQMPSITSKVDYQFIVDTLNDAQPEEANMIFAAWAVGTHSDVFDKLLGKAVRAQIEKYRQEILDIEVEGNQLFERWR